MSKIMDWIYLRKDLILNISEWGPGNPLWITGASGDGKSTMTEKLAEEMHATVITSDIVLCRMGWTKEKVDEHLSGNFTSKGADAYKIDFNNMTPAVKYVLSHPELPYGQKDPITKCIKDEVVIPELLKFYGWLMEELKDDDKMYIIEGCDICHMDPEVMINKPLIVMGGSRLRSFYRRCKRNCEEKGCSMLTSVKKYIRKYKIQNEKLDDSKDHFRHSLEIIGGREV